tara:strand:- start:20 stop:568 length:549 start_codon:yes stop_codon:yes gene_type:complete
MIEIINTSFEGLHLINRKAKVDDRGFFERLYCDDSLSSLLKNKRIQQINHSMTKLKATVRGLHYQERPYSEIKIVSCLKGEIWDLAVDLRRNSPSFLKYYGVYLSSERFQSIFIPEGFAHGFQTLSDNCELIYFHTERYMTNYEKGLNPIDPLLGIEWPLAISQLSYRDKNHKMIDQTFSGF